MQDTGKLLNASSAARDSILRAEDTLQQAAQRLSGGGHGFKPPLPAQPSAEGAPDIPAPELLRDIVELSSASLQARAGAATLRVTGSVADEVANLGRRVDMRA